MSNSRYIEWDVVNWGRALGFWRKHSTLDWRGAKVLEIGGRYGGLSLWMAEQGAEVLCTDKERIEQDRRILPGREVAGSIRYGEMDALDIGCAGQFDIVLFKSVLGGIGRDDHPERQRQAIEQIHKALRPGGELFFAENLVASALHRFLRKRFVRWGRQWRYVTIGEMRDYLAVFTEVRYATVGFLGAFGRSEWMRRLLGYVDRAGDWLIPPSWRYIILGVARKAPVETGD